MRNFKKLGTIDTSELKQELDNNKDLWNKNNLRTTHIGTNHADVDDIWILFPDIKKHTTAQGLLDDLSGIEYPALKTLPSVTKIVDKVMIEVKGKELGKVLITSLKPKGKILPHCDEGYSAKYYERYHVTIQSEEGNTFRTEDEFVHMKPDELWWFNNLNEHELYNGSSIPRIHLVMDIKG